MYIGKQKERSSCCKDARGSTEDEMIRNEFDRRITVQASLDKKSRLYLKNN
jgi:hypothetical protein